MGNVFNRYGAGGGKSEGLYIWKKSEIIPPITVINPSFTFDSTGVSKTLNLSNFDFTQIDNYIDFFDGFTDGVNAYFYVTDSVLYYHTGSANYSISTFNATNSSTATMTGGSFTSTKVLHFDGAKILQQAKVGNFIGYVVSDKEDAYPDGGEQGGFYYESFEPFNITGLLDLSHVCVGSVTLTGTQRTLTINHNMGVVPKVCYLWGEKDDGNVNMLGTSFTVNDTAGATDYTVQIRNRNATPVTGNTSTASRTELILYSNTSYMFEATTYHYVVVG